jgi:hypothetical protein
MYWPDHSTNYSNVSSAGYPITCGLQEGGGETAESALQGERVYADCDAQVNEEAPVRHNRLGEGRGKYGRRGNTV